MADNTLSNMVLSVKLDDPQTMQRHLRTADPHPQYVLVSELPNVTKVRVGLEHLNNVSISQDISLQNKVLAFNGSVWSPTDINILVHSEEASYDYTGTVTLASANDIKNMVNGAYAPTPYSVYLFCHNTFSPLGHKHTFTDITDVPFVITITNDNKISQTTIVTPNALTTYASPLGHQHSMDDVSGLTEIIEGHTHTIPEVNGLQEALDNKSDIGHPHSVDDVTGLQLMLDSVKASLLFSEDMNPAELNLNNVGQIFCNKGVILVPTKEGDTIAVQWGTDAHSLTRWNRLVSFHEMMDPVYHITITSVGSRIDTDADNILHLVNVTSEGFTYVQQDWGKANQGLGCKWLAIGKHVPRSRTLLFQWGRHSETKAKQTQGLTLEAKQKALYLSRPDIMYGYNCDFMLLTGLESSTAAFTYFLNSHESQADKLPCDWFDYGYAVNQFENSIVDYEKDPSDDDYYTVSSDTTRKQGKVYYVKEANPYDPEDDGVYSIYSGEFVSGVTYYEMCNPTSVAWVLDKTNYDFGSGWEKFKISANRSFVIQHGYFDISESDKDINDVSVHLPVTMTGGFHASFLLSNNKKASDDARSIDRLVYLKSWDSGSTIDGFICTTLRNGSASNDNKKLTYRVYWTVYGYISETNETYITGASIQEQASSSFYTKVEKVSKVLTPTSDDIGGTETIVTIPITTNNGITEAMIWRFGSMDVYYESTLPLKYGVGAYYTICTNSMSFDKDHTIITDFTCNASLSAYSSKGHYIIHHETSHMPWPYYDENGGIPVSVVLTGDKCELTTNVTWMVLGLTRTQA